MKKMSEQQVTSVKKWYVVRAISGKEKKVKQHLESEITRLKMSDYVSQILIPTEKVIQMRNGKKVNKERSFFPGYILVEAALVGEVPHIIKNIPGVLGFLGETKGGLPVPMRISEVNRILGKVDELAENEATVINKFIVGETVKVVTNPLTVVGNQLRADFGKSPIESLNPVSAVAGIVKWTGERVRGVMGWVGGGVKKTIEAAANVAGTTVKTAGTIAAAPLTIAGTALDQTANVLKGIWTGEKSSGVLHEGGAHSTGGHDAPDAHPAGGH